VIGAYTPVGRRAIHQDPRGYKHLSPTGQYRHPRPLPLSPEERRPDYEPPMSGGQHCPKPAVDQKHSCFKCNEIFPEDEMEFSRGPPVIGKPRGMCKGWACVDETACRKRRIAISDDEEQPGPKRSKRESKKPTMLEAGPTRDRSRG